MYTKEEIYTIFQSKNIRLINSIIEEGILQELEFNELELKKLRKSLKLNVKKLFLASHKNLQWTLLHEFQKSYFLFFGMEYIDVLLDLMINFFLRYKSLSKPTVRWKFQLLERNSKISLEEIKVLLENKLKDLSITRPTQFISLIVLVEEMFGDTFLINYLITLDYPRFISKMPIDYPTYLEALKTLSKAIFMSLSNSNKNAQLLLDELLKRIKSTLIRKEHPNTLNYIREFINYFFYQQKEELLIPMLKSITKDEFLSFMDYIESKKQTGIFRRLLHFMEHQGILD